MGYAGEIHKGRGTRNANFFSRARRKLHDAVAMAMTVPSKMSAR
jgi:hypothetical protein